MRATLLIFTLLALWLGGCSGTQKLPNEPGLEPVAGAFDQSVEWDYVGFIREALFQNDEHFHCLQVVSIGATVEAIFIPCVDGDSSVTKKLFHVVALDDVRAAYGDHREPSSVRVSTRTADIDDALWRALDTAFWVSVSNARYNRERRLIADGTRYEFVSSRTPIGTRAGSTHEPDANSSAGKVVQIARLLGQYADSPLVQRTKLRERIMSEAKRIQP